MAEVVTFSDKSLISNKASGAEVMLISCLHKRFGRYL